MLFQLQDERSQASNPHFGFLGYHPWSAKVKFLFKPFFVTKVNVKGLSSLLAFIKIQFYIRRRVMNLFQKNEFISRQIKVLLQVCRIRTLPCCVQDFQVNKVENHEIIYKWSKEKNLVLRWCDIKCTSTKTRSYLINNNNLPIRVKIISLPMKIYDKFSWFLLLIYIVHIHSSHIF